MENIELQQLWKEHSNQLESNRKLNLALLSEVKLDKARKQVNKILFLPISTLLFYSIMSIYCIAFAYTNSDKWYFVLSGILLSIFSLLFTATSTQQVVRILSLDYGKPLIGLQSELTKLKVSILSNLKIATWLLPFYPAFIILLSKSVFNLNFVEMIPSYMLLVYAAISLFLGWVSWKVNQELSERNLDSKWLKVLLRGNGNQIDKALGFIDQIDAFKKEV